MTEYAIDVHGVSKRFRVPLDHAATLQYRVSHPRSSSSFRELIALDNVTFRVEPGEFIGITGPNGCGKSTLLKIISGILVPDRGNASVNGRIAPFLELGIGFKDELTARENVFLGACMLGLTKQETAERVATVLQFAELEGFADQKIKNFSSGMTVRLAFSVAMLADADIMLMDEVLAVGDARFREKCFEVFDAYRRMGRTIVLVSHDIGSLELFCDRVVLLRDGRVLGDGPAHKVVADYRRIVAAMSEPQRQTEIAAVPADHDSPSVTRWGSREVEITNVRLLGADGEPRHTFNADEPMTVVVEYIGNEHVATFDCGIRVRAGNGHVLAKPFTRFSGHRLPEAQAGVRGSIAYRIASLPLLEGSFFVSAYLYDRRLQHAYDHLEDALEFRVADAAGRQGVIEIGGEWHNTRDGEHAPPGIASTHNGTGAGAADSSPPVLTAILARLSSGRTGSTLLMQLLATSRDVVIDRVYPFENAYVPCFLDMAARVGAAYQLDRDGTVHSLVAQLSSGMVARSGAIPFETHVIDRADLERRTLYKLWEAFSESARCKLGSMAARYYAEKLQPGVDAGAAVDAGIPVRVIDVVRDPRDVLASIRAFNKQRGFPSFGRHADQTEPEYVEYFLEYQRRMLGDIDTPLRGVQPILVRYEDMIADLGGVATRIGAALGISLDYRAVEAGRDDYRAHMTSDGAAGSMGRWLRDLDRAEVALIEQRLGTEMVRLGYSLSSIASR